jgi:uncharacterized protein (DUF433 family)
MKNLKRITLKPDIMGGVPCISGLRVSVGTVIGLLALGLSTNDILKRCPYLQQKEIVAALSYVDTQALTQFN